LKERNYIVGQFADFILNEDNPPIKCIFINKGNPLVQVGDINKTLEAFKKVEFIVAIDLFMTDSASHADIVLPATSIFEEEEFIYTGMYSPYLSYSNKVIEPLNNIIGEYELFGILAKKMKLMDYPDVDKETFFKNALKPLMEKAKVSYDYLKSNYFAFEGEEIPWQDGKFDTPSGKYELYSESAKSLELSPLPEYIPVREKEGDYKIRLLTPHPKNSLHSQHLAFDDNKPAAYINENTLRQLGFKNYALCIFLSASIS
jgi:anaerobic selenocysteine-containing dehydrogenase